MSQSHQNFATFEFIVSKKCFCFPPHFPVLTPQHPVSSIPRILSTKLSILWPILPVVTQYHQYWRNYIYTLGTCNTTSFWFCSHLIFNKSKWRSLFWFLFLVVSFRIHKNLNKIILIINCFYY